MPRKAATEARPDSRPDPQTPGPARTLKRSSRRHGRPPDVRQRRSSADCSERTRSTAGHRGSARTEHARASLPPRRATHAAEGLPPQECAHATNAVATLRHGIVRTTKIASAPSAQSPGNRHKQGCPGTAPLALLSLSLGHPPRAGRDQTAASGSRLARVPVHPTVALATASVPLISRERDTRTPEG
ncbi:hypothetical protein R6Z07F_010691 [Ovis aries]